MVSLSFLSITFLPLTWSLWIASEVVSVAEVVWVVLAVRVVSLVAASVGPVGKGVWVVSGVLGVGLFLSSDLSPFDQ